MRAEMLEESCNMRVLCRDEQRVLALQVFGKLQQIALISLATQRAKAFFDTQVGDVFAQQLSVVSGVTVVGHCCDYRGSAMTPKSRGINLVSLEANDGVTPYSHAGG